MGTILWDGYGCGVLNDCCQRQANQEYICTTLNEPTTDDIEVRICADELDEEVFLEQLGLYVLSTHLTDYYYRSHPCIV